MPLGDVAESDDVVSALAEHDDTLYDNSLGSEALSSSENSQSDSDSCLQSPAAKRLHTGDDNTDDDEVVNVDVLK